MASLALFRLPSQEQLPSSQAWHDCYCSWEARSRFSRLPQRDVPLRKLYAWADRMSIFTMLSETRSRQRRSMNGSGDAVPSPRQLPAGLTMRTSPTKL